MRRSIFALAALAAVAVAGTALSGRAEAAVAAPPGALSGAAQTLNVVDDAAYVCKRVRRCNRYGCHWRRACWHTGRSYHHRHYKHRKYYRR
jgi:hypothetical protein